MTVPSLLALLTLILALPLNVLVTVRLWALSRRAPKITVLRDRAIVATCLTVIVGVFAVVFVNNDLPSPIVGLADTKLITRVAVLVMSLVPAVYWLRRIYSDRTNP